MGTRRHQNKNAVPRRQSTRGAALALAPALVLSAYLMALTLGSQAYPWLALFALLPLLRAIQILSPTAATVSGGLWGISLFALSTTLVETAVVGSVSSLVLLTTIPAVYAGLGARLTRKVGFSPFILAYGWILVEIALRPIALRNGLLAGTQGNGWLIAVIGRGFGYVAVAFVMAFTSAWLLELVSRIRFRIERPVFRVVLDDAGSLLWHLIPSRYPCRILSPSHPRAPPIRR